MPPISEENYDCYDLWAIQWWAVTPVTAGGFTGLTLGVGTGTWLARTYGDEQVGTWQSHKHSKSGKICPWNSREELRGALRVLHF